MTSAFKFALALFVLGSVPAAACAQDQDPGHPGKKYGRAMSLGRHTKAEPGVPAAGPKADWRTTFWDQVNQN